MTELKKTAAIIGLGSFGQFVGRILSPYANIIGYDTQQLVAPINIKKVSFNKVSHADYIILAVPLKSYKNVLEKLQLSVKPNTVVIDTCSVKVKSRDCMMHILGNKCCLINCHPLFGPQSAVDGVFGHTIIVTNVVGRAAENVISFLQQVLGIKIIYKSAENHDQTMAYVHALTSFLARGLDNMHMPAMPFKTPSFDMITNLIDFDAKHSDDLFKTIQDGNPYAADVRVELIESLLAVHKQLEKK